METAPTERLKVRRQMAAAAGKKSTTSLSLFMVWNTRVFDDNVRHVCDTCFDRGKSESCLVKAPAMHASESVLVVGELLCTGVQANTERHTQGTKRAKCAHVGDTDNAPPRAIRESGVIQTSNRARVWQIWEAREDT